MDPGRAWTANRNLENSSNLGRNRCEGDVPHLRRYRRTLSRSRHGYRPKGHEIAGHGYHHEVARDLTRDEEREVMRRTIEMIEKRAGKRPVGWRSCTQSPNSL